MFKFFNQNGFKEQFHFTGHAEYIVPLMKM